MAQDSWQTASWRDKLKVWVARTGWRPADVAATNPREKNDLANFERYDPRVPALVSWYAFFQLVAVVVLLNVMMRAELAYWGGFSLWAMLLGTTVVTALWLDGRSAGALLKWEGLRLALLTALAIALKPVGVNAVLAVAYVLANVVFLSFLVHTPGDRSVVVATES